MRIADVYVALRLDRTDLDRGLQGLQTNLAGIGKGMSQMGRSLTTNVTLPIVAIGGAAVKMGVDFETTMNRMVGLAGISRGSLEGIRNSINEIAVATGKGPQDLAEAFYFVASAGFEAEEAMEVLEMAARASASGMGEVQDIARVLGGVVNAYGKENLTAAQAADIMTAAVAEGAAEASAFANVLPQVVPAAAQLGVGLDQVTGSIAAMTTAGTSAEMAAVGLNQIFVTLLKPTAQAEETLGKFGLTAQGLRDQLREEGLISVLRTLEATFGDNDEAMTDVFGNVRAMRGAFSLLGLDATELDKIMAATADSTGALDDAFNATDDEGRSLARSWAELQIAGIELGRDVMPTVVEIFKQVAGAIRTGITWWKSLDAETKQTIINFALFAAVAGPVLTILGKLVTVLSGVVGGVRLMVAAGALMHSAWVNIPTLLGYVDLALQVVRDGFVTVRNALFDFARVLGGSARDAIAVRAAALGTVFRTAFETAAAAASRMASAVGGAISGLASALRGAAMAAGAAIGALFQRAFTAASTSWSESIIGGGVNRLISLFAAGLERGKAVLVRAAVALGAAFSAAFGAAATAIDFTAWLVRRSVQRTVAAGAAVLGAIYAAAFNAAATVADFVGGFADNLLRAGRKSVLAVGATLGAIFGAAFSAASTIAEVAVDIASGLLRYALTPVTKSGAVIGAAFGVAFSAAATAVDFAGWLLRRSLKPIVAVAAALGGAFGAAFSGAAAAASAIGGGIGGAIATMLGVAGAGLTKFVALLGPVGVAVAAFGLAMQTNFLGIGDAWEKTVNEAGPNFTRMAMNFGDMAAETDQIADRLGMDVQDLRNDIRDLMIDAGISYEQAVLRIAQSSYKASDSLIEQGRQWELYQAQISGAAETGARDAANSLAALPPEIQQILTDAGIVIDDGAGAAFDGVSEEAQAAREAAVEAMGNMLDAMANLFETDDEVQQAFSDLLDRMDDPYTDAELKADIFGDNMIAAISGALRSGSTGLIADTRVMVNDMLRQIETMEPGALASGKSVPPAIRAGMDSQMSALIKYLADEQDIILGELSLAEAEKLGLDGIWLYAKGMQRNSVVATAEARNIALRTKEGMQSADFYGAGSSGGSSFASGVGSRRGSARYEGQMLGWNAGSGIYDYTRQAWTWGNNAGNAFANGLRFSAAAVAQAARALGGQVHGQIGIYSEPEDHSSPMFGITQWGGNIVKTIAQGIYGELSTGSRAAAALAAALRPAVSDLTPALGLVSASGASGLSVMGAPSGNTINLGGVHIANVNASDPHDIDQLGKRLADRIRLHQR